MKLEEMSSKIEQYALTVLAPNAKTWSAKFAIGALAKPMSAKAMDLAVMSKSVDENGCVDIQKLHDMVSSGFSAAGHLDLFGGIVGFDQSDVENLFSFMGQ